MAGLLLAASACGGDGERRDGPWEVRDSGKVVIITDDGVRLRGMRTDGVSVDGRTRARWSEGSSTLDLSCPENGAACDRMPTVSLPEGASVTVTARNAGIEAAGLTGSLDLSTVNGDIVLAGGGSDRASARLVTQNGSVRVAAQRAAALTAQTTNGDVTLGCDTAPAGLTATTVNGSVRITLPAGSPSYTVTTATDHGQTHVTVPTAPDADHHLELRTTNGDLSALTG